MGTINRATGQRINHFDKMTKSDVVFFMKEQGFELEFEVLNKGAWNQSRFFFVMIDGERHNLYKIMRGEKANWDDMWSAFKAASGVRDR